MFNHQARWDRQLPGDSETGLESLEVTARFVKGKISPLFFVFHGARFKVENLHYVWRERKGNIILYFFSVSDARDRYCLCLNSETMAWRLIQQE